MEAQVLDLGAGTIKINPGRYILPEISGDVTISIDIKDKVHLEDKIYGKGKVVINNAYINVTCFEGDMEVVLNNCWITSPFVNKASSLLLRGCTVLLSPNVEKVIVNEGLKLAVDNLKVVLAGELENNLTIISNQGELFTCIRLNCFLHFGHNLSMQELTFLESTKGQVDINESGICLSSRLKDKPVLVKGSKSLIKLNKFILYAEQDFISTRVEECQVYFTQCHANNKPIQELDEKQEVLGDYSSHMSGKVHIINARKVYVDTQKAPVVLQLPLQAKHNELIMVQKQYKSGFPVKIRTTRDNKEFILGQGHQKPCFLVLRFSSKGWVEKQRGDEEGTLNIPSSTTSQHKKSTQHRSKSKSTTKSKSMVASPPPPETRVSRSAQLREKFKKGREVRKELFG